MTNPVPEIKAEVDGEITYVKNEWGEFPTGAIPDFSRIKGNKGRLNTNYTFVDKNGKAHTAFAGMIYDGGSVPKALWGISTNPWADDIVGPATIHDKYCQEGRAGVSELDSGQVHRLFYEMERCIGVPEWRARPRYIGVYLRGPRFKACNAPSYSHGAS